MTTTATQGHTNGRHAIAAPTCPRQNVNDTERMVSMLSGGALAFYGLTRGSLGGALLALFGGSLVYRGVTGHCHMYDALGISTVGKRGPASSIPAGQGVKMEKSMVVNRPASELYHYWRNLRNIPNFMRHIRSITVEGNRSHWVAGCPVGFSLEWDAEIINDHTNELIAWRSLPGSEVDSAGSVHFESAGNGTRVSVIMKYDPPGGRFVAALAHLFGHNPEAQLEEDLRRFKQIMESGQGSTVPSPTMARMSWPER